MQEKSDISCMYLQMARNAASLHTVEHQRDVAGVCSDLARTLETKSNADILDDFRLHGPRGRWVCVTEILEGDCQSCDSICFSIKAEDTDDGPRISVSN